MERGHLQCRSARRPPFGTAVARALRRGEKRVVRSLLALGLLRYELCERGAIVPPERRPEQITGDNIQSDQVGIPAPREIERQCYPGVAAKAIVDMDEQGLVAHVSAFSSEAEAVDPAGMSAACAGIIRTGQDALRKTRSATLPSTRRRNPRRPCVPMTIRSACHSVAIALMRCATSSPGGETSTTRGVPVTLRFSRRVFASDVIRLPSSPK